MNQIRSLPDLDLVLQSGGVASSDNSFTDDLLSETSSDIEEETDKVKQLLFLLVGTHNPRPHLLVLHVSGRLNSYEAQPRFTMDASQQARRSLAVRFRKVHTMLLPINSSTRLPYTLIPFTDIEGHSGAFITGERPHWILSSDSHPLKAVALKQAAMAFGRTTHLGGKGEYFIRIEDVRRI